MAFKLFSKIHMHHCVRECFMVYVYMSLSVCVCVCMRVCAVCVRVCACVCALPTTLKYIVKPSNSTNYKLVLRNIK